MTRLYLTVLSNPLLGAGLAQALGAASVAQGMGSVAGVIQMVGYIASGAMLISAGLAAAGERSIGGLKTALVLAGVAAGAFAISTWMFNAFGGNINVSIQNPN